MDNFNIISSIIQILIGAAFGGFAVYLTARDKLRQAQNSSYKRRIVLIEQVSQHVGKVSHVFSKYSSLISDIGPKIEHVSNNQHQELEDLSNQLVEVYEQVSIAESKLLLLGEKRLEKALKLYTGKMAQFRKQFYPGRYNHNDDTVALRKEVSQMREQFYDVLSERYDANTKL